MQSKMKAVAERVMALDWGMRRIGIAVSDALGVSSNGLPTLRRTNIDADLRALTDIVRSRRIAKVVVGRPLHMNGSAGKSANLAEQFARRLAKRAAIDVVLWDERLTSWQAESLLPPRRRDKGAVDRAAAMLLLESYLAAQKP